jgi:hypothetical protein
MNLLHKLRTLVGALMHAPFTSRLDRPSQDEQPPSSLAAARPVDKAESAELEARPSAVADTDRVADLIARRKGAE